MKKTEQNYWFPAKKYGWGWGFPSTWQGWLVFVVFILAMIFLPHFINPAENMFTYLATVTGAAVILIAICYLKGEPPKWRWGKSDDLQDSDNS